MNSNRLQTWLLWVSNKAVKTLALSICGCTNSNPFVKHQMLLFMVPVLFRFFFDEAKAYAQNHMFTKLHLSTSKHYMPHKQRKCVFSERCCPSEEGFFVCLFVSLVCLVWIFWLIFESNRCEPAPRKEHSNLSYLQKKHPLTDHTHFPARSLRGHRDKALVIYSVSACGCDWIMTYM